MQLLLMVCAAVACAGLTLASASASASAAQIRIAAGVTLNLIDGRHDTGTEIERLGFVPLPLAEVDARLGSTVLHLEGLPPVSLRYGNPGSPQQTQLSLLNAVVRQRIAGGLFVGAGQTVLDQRTTYAASFEGEAAQQSSRVTGARVEAGFARRVGRATNLEGIFALNPAMHGVEHSRVTGFSADLIADERAALVDVALRFTRPAGPGELVYGLRYINYASRYDRRGSVADGLLADRNTGFMPLAGFRLRF